MIVAARHRLPRTMNYRRNGMWPGMGVFNPPPQPQYEVCNIQDVICSTRNQVRSDAYESGMDKAQAQDSFDQCMQNAQNANTQAQYNDVVARCNQQYQIQAAPDVPTLPQFVQAPPPGYVAPVYTPNAYAPTAGVFGDIWSSAPSSPAPVVQPAAPVVAVPTGSTAKTTPQGQVIVTSSGADLGSGSPFATPPPSSFSFSSIPTWGWAAAAGVALMFFGGGNGR